MRYPFIGPGAWTPGGLGPTGASVTRGEAFAQMPSPSRPAEAAHVARKNLRFVFIPTSYTRGMEIPLRHD